MPTKDELIRKLGAIPQASWKRRPEVLLQQNLPKPLHQVNPRTILGDSWWNKTRQAAYESTAFHCIACGVYKNDAEFRHVLDAHECYEINYVKGLLKFLEVVPLCISCHSYIHSGRLEMLLRKGEIPQARYVKIIQHGDKVLRDAGLLKPEPYGGPFAEWSKWRLVIDGKKYPPKFKSYDEWAKHFSGSEE